jgi:hypothetical protein
VEGGAELTCLWVAAIGRLLKDTLAFVGWDVLQPDRVSPKMERKTFVVFLWTFLGFLTSSLF